MRIYVKRPLVVFSVVFALIVYCGVSLFPPKVSENLADYDNKGITFTGSVYKKEVKNNLIRLYLKDSKTKERVITYTDLGEMDFYKVKIGNVLTVRGRFSLFPAPENEGMFDSRRYYLIKGINGSIKNAKISINNKSYHRISEDLCALRYLMERVFARYLSNEDAGIMDSLILGDKNELDNDVKDLYQSAGIAHILSLSGLHIAAVGLFLLKMLMKTPFPMWFCYLFSIIVMAGYALLTGMSISTMRALIMFVVSIMALLLGRSYDLLSCAALATIISLIINPYLICDTAFLLSFGAIVAISVVFPSFSEAFSSNNIYKQIIEDGSLRWHLSKSVGSIKESIILSISITLTTLPIIASSFYKTSIFGFLLNLFVIPLMGVILALGFAGLNIGTMLSYVNLRKLLLFFGISNFLESLNCILFKIIHVILLLYKQLSHKLASISINTFVLGKPSAFRVVIYYILLSLTLLIIRFFKNNDIDENAVDLFGLKISSIIKKSQVKFDNKKTSVTSGLYLNDNKSSINLVFIGNLRFWNFVIRVKELFVNNCLRLLIIFIICLSVVILTNRNISDVEIHTLSVGQGDCNLIFGKKSPVILVDGGSSDVKNVGKYRIEGAILSGGIDKIDYLFISHFDDDHFNGLMEIFEDNYSGIRIKNIIMSTYCYPLDFPEGLMESSMETPMSNNNSSSDETLKKVNRLLDIAKQKNIKVFLMKKGDSFNDGTVKFTCLWPNKKYINDNDGSLVLKIEWEDLNFSALFTGDISMDSEEGFIQDIGHCDFLKVAHHGSKYSTSESLLKKISPRIAVISCGKNNSYGHPHKETLERLSRFAQNTKVLRTDDCGQVTVRVNKGKVQINRFILR